jgi:signal transduction histidine kinase
MGPMIRFFAGLARSPVADIALALALAAQAQIEIWWPTVALGGADTGGLKSVLVPTALLATLPLAVRRRYPFAVLCVTVGGLGVQALLTIPPEGMSSVLAVVVAAYSVAAYAERGQALIGLAIAAGTTFMVFAGDPSDIPFDAFVVGAPWLAGWGLRRSRLYARRLESLTEQLAAEREERARLAVAAERSRIARELHDVVAHTISTMVVQAEAGEAVFDGHPQRARKAFQSIQESGREALTEMRRALGLLRRDDRELVLAPQPSVVHLENLLGRVRDAGLAVELKVEGQPRPLPPGLDLSAYRIVQEALTNTLKHASGDHAWVTVRYGDRELELKIDDNGPSRGDGATDGHGITGMRERAQLFGGKLEFGRRSAGGCSVRAWMPYQT